MDTHATTAPARDTRDNRDEDAERDPDAEQGRAMVAQGKGTLLDRANALLMDNPRKPATAVAPARPTSTAVAPGDSEDIAGRFADVRRRLGEIVGDSGQRIVELKLAATEAIDRALSRLEDEARSARERLARNEELVREAQRAADESTRLAAEQEALEHEVGAMRDRSKELATQVTALETERRELESARQQADAAVKEKTEAISKLGIEVNGLEERGRALDGEVQKLGRAKGKLEEDVARLERLRDEYLAAIRRLRDAKDDLTSAAEESAGR